MPPAPYRKRSPIKLVLASAALAGVVGAVACLVTAANAAAPPAVAVALPNNAAKALPTPPRVSALTLLTAAGDEAPAEPAPSKSAGFEEEDESALFLDPIAKGDVEVVQKMLEMGLSPNPTRAGAESPIRVALARQATDAKGASRIVELLVAHGAEVPPRPSVDRPRNIKAPIDESELVVDGIEPLTEEPAIDGDFEIDETPTVTSTKKMMLDSIIY
jgi:hypothetical protein